MWPSHTRALRLTSSTKTRSCICRIGFAFLCDPHPLVLAGLQQQLLQETQFLPVGHCESSAEAPECCERLQPNVVLLGHPVQEVNEALQRDETTALSRQKVLLLSTRGSSSAFHAQAVRMGVRGIFLKEAPLPLLPQAIRQVDAGHFWCDPSIVSVLVEAAFAAGATATPRRSHFEHLNPRQRRIADLVLQRKNNGEIAADLLLSQDTVARELTSIYDAVDVQDRVQLLIRYKPV